MKLKPFSDNGSFAGYAFYCPGCEHAHHYYVPRWSYSGPTDRPTFSPSLKVFIPKHDDEGTDVPEQTICHLFLTNGKLRFLDDCRHKLAGKIVDLPDWPYERST